MTHRTRPLGAGPGTAQPPPIDLPRVRRIRPRAASLSLPGVVLAQRPPSAAGQ